MNILYTLKHFLLMSKETRFAKEKFLTTYFDERVRTCFPYHFVSRGWFSMRTIFYRVSSVMIAGLSQKIWWS